MKTPILGSSYVARSVNAADSRMVNLYPEIVPEGGKEPAFLQRCPGLRLLTQIGDGPIRGLWTYGGLGYVVSGNALYSISSTAQQSQYIGYITGSGPVCITDNGTQMFIACNGPSYIYNNITNVLAQITDPDFPGAVGVGFLDGYFVFTEPNSQRVWVTALLDGLSVDPLDFASAEGSPDGLVTLNVNHREVWLFGTDSVEVWYDAGNPDFPLARIQGAFNEIGCLAAYSVAKLSNTVFWLGADARGRGIVYMAEGYNAVRVSTHAVEWNIQQYTTLSDAVGYTYQQDGHNFYVLNFPAAKTTWVYDVSTQVWHERASWINGEFDRHRGNCQMSFLDKIIIGDYQNNNVYYFDLTYYEDNGDIQRWLRSWRALPTGQNDLKRTVQHSLQLDCESGVGLDVIPIGTIIIDYLNTETPQRLITESGNNIILDYVTAQGADPQAMLRWSDDGGHTWSNEHWKAMGKLGRYGYRVIWRRLGMTMKLRDRVYELSGTDPVKIAIMGAELILGPTNA